jgi:hypothetical protein
MSVLLVIAGSLAWVGLIVAGGGLKAETSMDAAMPASACPQPLAAGGP